MPKKLMLKVTPLIAAILILTLLVAPVFAQGGGHLWFYSQDPDTLPWPNTHQLPNPEDVDPKYIDTNSDEWLSESVLIPSDEWETFSIWLACAKFESLNTKLVISINDAAHEAIETITVNGNQIDSWQSGTPSALAPHGVFNAVDFFGYAEINVGDLDSPPNTPYKTEITINIDLKEGADLSNAKIHFDAYGQTSNAGINFSPYSHDMTFVVPEAATIFLTSTSLFAFGIYAYKRRKN